jgi:hypothetical protein
MFFRKGQALGSVQVTDSGDPDETKAVSMAEVLATSPEPTPEPEPDAPASEPEPEKAAELERPKVADNKAAWVAYAISQGMDRELAEDESTTKQDLIDSYGG